MYPLVKSFSLFLVLFGLSLESSACVDSVWYQIDTVRCNGSRDGGIMVTKVFGGQEPYYFSIDGQSFSTNPSFDHLWTGAYTLSVRDGSGCVTTLSVNVPEPDEMTVWIKASDTSIIAGKELILRAIIYPENTVVKSVKWSPEELFPKQDITIQKISISKPRIITVEVSNINNCKASDQVKISLDPVNIYFPNAIRPGSEDNASFTVYSGEGVQKVSSLTIYGRNGATLFDKHNFPPNDPKLGWNARLSGEKVQSGVYLWVADLEMLDGTHQHFDGTVTVIE